MSMTKRELDEINEAASPAKCPDCKFNWDDKFYVYCPKHQAEAEEMDFYD